MAGAIDVKCPACAHLTQVTSAAAGRQARCQCGFTFMIPEPGSVELVEDAFEADAVGTSPVSLAANDSPSVESAPSVHSTFHPSPGGATSRRDRDEDPLLPPEIESLLDSDEVVWYSERPPVKAIYLRIFSRLLAIGTPLLLLLSGAVAAGNGGGICLGMTGLAVLGVAMVEMYLGWKMRFYTITDRRTLVRGGLLVCRISLVPHTAVTMVSLKTGFMERWSQTRTIRLHTPASARGGLLLANSAQAERVVRLLNQPRPTFEEPP